MLGTFVMMILIGALVVLAFIALYLKKTQSRSSEENLKAKGKKDEKERRETRNDQRQIWTDKDTDLKCPWTVLCYHEYTFYNSFN